MSTRNSSEHGFPPAGTAGSKENTFKQDRTVSYWSPWLEGVCLWRAVCGRAVAVNRMNEKPGGEYDAGAKMGPVSGREKST